MRHLFTFCLLSLCSLLRAQSTPNNEIPEEPSPSAISIDSLGTNQGQTVTIGYGQQHTATIGSAITQLNTDHFNQGLISDPLQLVQGRIAGLQVYNRGGDPNRRSLLRVRGASLGANPDPLVVIDGIIGASLDQLDPNDVESITLLKDGTATAIYGLRAAAGVLLIRTKQTGEQQTGWQLSYHGQGASTDFAGEVPVLDAASFLAAGGNDLGTSTNWSDQVIRTAFSQAHGLAISSATPKTKFRFSTNYRNVEGILQYSGFEQINNRVHFTTRAFQDRLTLTVDGAYTYRKSNYSFSEAFRYAYIYNPTAPVRGEDAPFPFDSEQYGGFFETLGLFDSYNPVSILEQNSHINQRSAYTLGAKADYQFSDRIKLTARVGNQSADLKERAYYAPTSLFRGNASSPQRKGRADYLSASTGFRLYEAFATYTHRTDRLGVTILTGYSQQRFRGESRWDAFGNLEATNYDFESSLDAPTDLSSLLNTVDQFFSPDQKISGLFTRVALDWNSGFFVNLATRGERYSRNNTKSSWATLAAVSTGMDLNKRWQLEQVQQLKIRAGYNLNRSLPRSSGLGTANFSSVVYNGQAIDLVNAGSPAVKPEQQSELNLGLDFATDRLRVTIDVYNRQIKDMLIYFVPDQAIGMPSRYENAGGLRTRGAELSLGYELIRKKQWNWRTGIIASTNRTVLEAYFLPQVVRGNLGSPGQNGVNLIRLSEGEEIGQIWGPVFVGVSPQGNPTFADLNNDGQVLTSQNQSLNPDADFTVLGNARPDLEFGWSNQIRCGSWSVDAFFRGALGHSLVNTFRAFYEPRLPTQSAYNYVNTELAIPALRSAQFSSLYVEKANFLKLDNLSLAKQFTYKDGRRRLTISLTGQNLWVWTNYSGLDPEPALVDYGTVSNEEMVDYSLPDAESPGIDRRYSYWPSRTVVLGVKVRW